KDQNALVHAISAAIGAAFRPPLRPSENATSVASAPQEKLISSVDHARLCAVSGRAQNENPAIEALCRGL
ncbi:MAG: hypothetical protein U1D06_13330, partial [Paracoccaceae bacterium]|nr:hypothetical protein [Paracoccaceae bacterium]